MTPNRQGKDWKCPKGFHEIFITLDSWNLQCRYRYFYFYFRWASLSIRLMRLTANYTSQTNHSHEWKLLLNIQQNKIIYKPPFWKINSRSYLSWVANYPFFLHVETQTNLIYDGVSMTNLSTNGAVRQQLSRWLRSKESLRSWMKVQRAQSQSQRMDHHQSHFQNWLALFATNSLELIKLA